MILGMDFGTTNSGMAVYDGAELRTIPLDASGAGGAIDRTALYITHDHHISTGQQAIDRYLAQNVGRPVRMERVRVGTISVTAAEIGTYYRDVHIQSDVLSPGRLFTSFKTFLASTSFEGTVIGGLTYALDDIVATYLHLAKMRAERFLGREAHAIVLGRPVAFSRDPEADVLARDRLVGAALRAGYDSVYVQYEPVAAALQYETTLRREQVVLIFDFGGGTLDVTIMRLGNPKTREVLATAGLPVAGDIFDQRIVRLKLAPLFGEGSAYGPPGRTSTVPTWIYDALSDWQSIITLQQPENRAVLEDILATARQPRSIRNLIELAAKNYGLALYTAVEAAKRTLSDETEAVIQFHGATFSLHEPLTRGAFEALILQETQEIEQMLKEVVLAAGLAPSGIDAVVRTGGSSRIPVFVAMLRRIFGAEKVRDIDAFSSVTAGLAVAARRIDTGELEAAPYRQDGRSDTAPAISTRARAIDPGFLSAWVAAHEQATVAPNPCAAITWVTTGYELVTTELGVGALDVASPIALEGAASATQARLTGLDDRLVLVTSAYRFLLATPRQLLVLARGGLRLSQVHGFTHGEVVCALTRWDDLRDDPRLAVVSSRGRMRVIGMERVRDRLDRSIPFTLETTSESDPVALVGLNGAQRLTFVTSAGRALRFGMTSVPFHGIQAIKREKQERLVGCVAVEEADHLLIIAADGTARRLDAGQVPLVTEPNTRGAPVATRMAVRCAVRHDPRARLWLLTSRYLRPVAPALLSEPPALGSKPLRLAALDAGEQVIAAVTTPV